MTLRMILGWWRQDLTEWWARRRPFVRSQPAGKEGRMLRFSQRGTVMGYQSYTVWARRGQFTIGRLEYRNQWGYYAFYPDSNHHVETPLNREIVAEIYAMLKELGS
jgi:hypothetical protein